MSELSDHIGAAGNRPSLKDRGLEASIFIAASGAWFFEQSPLNEVFRADIAFETLDRTHNAIMVGGSVAAATLAIEMIPASLIAIGANRDGGVIDKYIQRRLAKKNQLSEDDGKTPYNKKINHLSDFAISMGIGAGAVVGKEHLKDSEPTLEKDMKTAVRSSTYVALGSGAIGFLAGGGINYADKVGLENQAEFVVEHGTDWKVWAGVFAVIQGISFAKKGFEHIKDRINRNKNPQPHFESHPTSTNLH